MGETVAIASIAILLIMYIILLIFLIATYVLQSLALHTLARRRGIASPWLAWLPFGNYWIIGSLARDYDKQNNIKRRWDKTMLILSIVFFASYVVVYIGAIVCAIIAELNAGSAAMIDEAAIALVLGMVFAFAFIPVIMVATALQIINYICFFKIFESTVPEKALKYFLLTLLVPLAQPICLFLCRNKGYAHPDPMAYLYAPVNKNYTYYHNPAQEVEPVEQATEISDTVQEQTDTTEENKTEE